MSLKGKRVLITRAVEDTSTLRRALEARGAQAVSLPTIRRAPPSDTNALRTAAAALPEVDCVAVGSLSALRPLMGLVTQPTRAVVGCVGTKTARGLDDDPALADRFLGPRVVPEVHRAEALVDALLGHFQNTLEGLRALVPRAPQGRPVLVEGLRAAGADVHDVITYEILPAPAPTPEAWSEARAADVALFMSGETLANFFMVVPEPEARALLDRVVVGVIGPVAERRARQLDVRVDVTPPVATQEALLDALDAHLGMSQGSDR